MQRTLEKLAKILQRIREFLVFRARKICAISVLNANFCVAKCCIDSSESCADVRSFTPRALGKCNRVFRAPRAEIAKNSATNSSFDDANFARARRQTRKFSSQNAPSDAAASSVYNLTFCNDAGWICGVLCITDAENLQRVRELLRGKFARSRRSRRCTRIFCVAKRCADSDENPAPPLAIIWHTSRDLCSARSRNSRKFCNNFANF